MATVHKLPFVPHRPRGCAGCFEDGSRTASPESTTFTPEPARADRPPVLASPREEVAWAALEPSFEVSAGAQILLPATSGPEGGLHTWRATGPGVKLVGGLATGTARLRGVRPGRFEVTYAYVHAAGMASVTTTVEVKPLSLAWRGWAEFGGRQYVNEDHPRAGVDHGRDVELTCAVTPPRAGVPLSFMVENVARVKGGPPAGVLSPGSRLVLTDAHGEARARLRLSTHGGDRCRVGVSLADTGDDDPTPVVMSGEIEVWRKLYYQITEMTREDGTGTYELPESVLSKVKSAYAKVFVALEPAGTRGTAPYVMNALVEPKARVRGKFLRDWRAPLKLHFFSADLVLKPVDTEWIAVATGPEIWQDERWLPCEPGRPLTTDIALRAQYLWLGEATWRPLPPGLLRLLRTEDGRGVTMGVVFEGSELEPSEDRKLLVRVRYTRVESVLGYQMDALGASLTICRGMVEFNHFRDPAAVEALLVRVLTHEAGHALGLVGPEIATRDSDLDHCTAKCVMKSASGPKSPADFHTEENSCAAHLRALDLSRDGPRAAIWEA